MHVIGTDTTPELGGGGNCGSIGDYHQNHSWSWRGRSEGVPHNPEKEIEPREGRVGARERGGGERKRREKGREREEEGETDTEIN